jgi:putative ABC transport system permease protein
VVRFVGRAEGVQLVLTPSENGFIDDPEFQSDLATRAKEFFDSRGLQVRAVETIASTRENIEYVFSIIVSLLTMMAVLIAVVGGLGLMGTMTINVIERTREIGVMRAVGASDASVMKVFIVEGLLIGALSWLTGALIAFPIGKLLSDAVGYAFLEDTLTYTYSIRGVLMWAAIVLVLSVLASILPAWRASRLTVREVLAYE